MKRNNLSSIAGILFILILPACQSNLTIRSLSTETKLAQGQIRPTNTPLPDPNSKAGLIAQIEQVASTYNRFVENEKKTGSFDTISLPNGATGFRFTKESYIKIFKEDVAVHQKIDELNHQYYQIYKEEMGPVSTATFSSNENYQTRLAKLLLELKTWLPNELDHGTTVSIYSLALMQYSPLLIGESFSAEQEKEDEINAIKLSMNNISQESTQLDIIQIQNIEPGSVSLSDIGTFPYYRTDIKLTTYETATRIYNVYSQIHQIIEILPKQLPPAATSSSISDLKKTAREMIAKFSPGENLDKLTSADGAKDGTYFFRWEDRTKPLLDDGMNYPFIQVGLNGKGELLNYYNTLPLAR